jgi:HAD superfamily hydrolase (TIGR01459 family)
LTDHFSVLAPLYDAVLSDVWGVVHNGMTAFPEAGEALANFRATGGAVVLISNAPRRGAWVTRQLDKLGVSRRAYDDIVTSGDVTSDYIAEHPGKVIFHLGPERDLSIFSEVPVEVGSLQRADYVVCTGLFHDDVETPEDYRELLRALRQRELLMLCANPDFVVERGDRLVYCAGAVADLYARMGGQVLYAGKPHRPIYDHALAKIAAARGAAVPLNRVLAIGDSVRTDLKGAAALYVDSLFVTAGIHAEELGEREAPDLRSLAEIFSVAGVAPRAVMRRLVW